jgi:two-component system chemotaxis sensor kinase CheA
VVGCPLTPIHPTALLKVVVLSIDGLRLALVVDVLVGEQEMVVKNLDKHLLQIPNVMGATLMGTGDVVIILNPAELIRTVQGLPIAGITAAVEEVEAEVATVLVVDDSITTRTLEKNILEAAGYQVVTAMNGLEALRYLQYNTCDLVVSDVQMPHMDGFELTQKLKSSQETARIPLILVTSLESPADRERGLAAGANAYIIKSGFNQDNLLSTIRQLL